MESPAHTAGDSQASDPGFPARGNTRPDQQYKADQDAGDAKSVVDENRQNDADDYE
jgi:hypothetical protein